MKVINDLAVDSIELAQRRLLWLTLLKTVMKLWVLRKAEDFLNRCAIVSFSKRAVVHGIS
jgi:hypothetical protein